jgi:hypothetical protein
MKKFRQMFMKIGFDRDVAGGLYEYSLGWYAKVGVHFFLARDSVDGNPALISSLIDSHAEMRWGYR